MKDVKPGRPIFLENTPAVICEQVLWLIKNSGLDFHVKETPFSLDVQLKKKFTNHWTQKIGSFVPQQPAPHLFQPQESHVFHEQLSSLKTKLQDALDEKDSESKEMVELNKVHKKLFRENKELLTKHEQVCAELRSVKSEKDNISKENNSLSVALKTSRKNLETNSEKYEKERNIFKAELEKLNRYKSEMDSEMKKAQKVEKKARQKAKKEAKRSEEMKPDSKSEPPDCSNVPNDTVNNYTAVKIKEDTAEEDVPIKADEIEPPRKILKARTKAGTPKNCDTSVLNMHTDDSVEELEEDASKDVEVKASETIQASTDISNSLVSSASAPLTKADLKEVWDFFAERSERLKSWSGST